MSGDDQPIHFLYQPEDTEIPSTGDQGSPESLKAGAVGLGDFMSNLGGMLGPARKLKRTDWAKVFVPRGYMSVVRLFSVVVWEEKVPDRPLSRFRRRLRQAFSYAVYGGALMAIGGLGVALIPKRSDPLPKELKGVWATTASAYADRTFEIADDALVFKTGDRPSDYEVFTIIRVRAAQLSERVQLYRVTYSGTETTAELSFQYESMPTPRIRFEHQKDMTWRRQR